MLGFGRKLDLEEGDTVEFIDHDGNPGVGEFQGKLAGGYYKVEQVANDCRDGWKLGLRPEQIIVPQPKEAREE